MKNTSNFSYKTISASLKPKSFFCLLTFLAVLVLSSCKQKDDELGLNLIPGQDYLNTTLSDTAAVLSTTVLDDSVKSDELSAQLIGVMNDPVFGITKASVFAQVNLQGTPVFSNLPVADSLVLILTYSGYYGDTTAQQNISVHRMTENMYVDSSYYSNRTFSFDPTPLGTTTFTPAPTTKVVVGTDTLKAQIRNPLSRTLADSLILLSGQPQYGSNAAWLEYFKGLYIQVTNSMSPNSGSINYFDFFNSNLTLYFHDTVSTKLYRYSLSGGRLNRFEHDYTGTNVALQLADSTIGDTLNYIQSMAGVRTKVSFPYLKHFKDSGSIVINRAELKMTVRNGNSALYPVPSKLYLVARNSSGSIVFPIDYFETAGYYGGNFSSSDLTYTFTITRQIQRYLDGVEPNNEFYIVIAGNAVLANRLVIGSGRNADNALKLKLYYTRLNQ